MPTGQLAVARFGPPGERSAELGVELPGHRTRPDLEARLPPVERRDGDPPVLAERRKALMQRFGIASADAAR